MADILALVFRTFGSQTDPRPPPCSTLVVGDPRPAAPPACSTLVVGDPRPPPCSTLVVGDPGPAAPPACSTLVVGDPGIGRSVLLLAAVAAASEMGVKVMFFSQTQIQSLPVSLQKCVSGLSPESLKRIQFSYPRTLEELLQQVASLHESCNTCPTPASLIIVDRLGGFLRGSGGGPHPGEPSRAAHLAALLCDSAAFLTRLLKQRRSSAAPCRVIASLQPEEDAVRAGAEASAADPILDVLDRYFQVRCTLDRERSYEAAAAGLQEVWHVYLSGTGLSGTGLSGTGLSGTGLSGTGLSGTGTAALTKDCEDRPAVAQEWQLFISPDGSMQFKLV
ncbi:ATPase SWSAP1 isoform X2 [Perca fluviatilis]|uniref:ATPase SWSAP1 isoform X2 n=1 Tax=Perca fluviatilis TaxID=8168 RepID=UPI00196487A0|nr:ATPase SWSAP1 isoform X2 [Perca fluviatilis]